MRDMPLMCVLSAHHVFVLARVVL
uniref:Uncharacterized protein n=1 Tax=Arundo donax TaxID=35708 RepID=A0A0A8Y163_ARUDO